MLVSLRDLIRALSNTTLLSGFTAPSKLNLIEVNVETT